MKATIATTEITGNVILPKMTLGTRFNLVPKVNLAAVSATYMASSVMSSIIAMELIFYFSKSVHVSGFLWQISPNLTTLHPALARGAALAPDAAAAV